MKSWKFSIKLALSLFFVLILPCLLIYIVYTNFEAKAISSQLEEIIIDELQSSLSLVNSKLDSYQDKINFLSRNEGYKSYALKQTFSTNENGNISSLVISEDQSYIFKLDSSIDCIFMYLGSSDTIISSGNPTTISKPDIFFTKSLITSDNSDIEASILNCRENTILRYEDLTITSKIGDYLLLIYPLNIKTADYAVICIPSIEFSNLFAIHKESLGVKTAVFSKDGRLLFDDGFKENELTSISFSTLASHAKSNKSIKLEGKEYRVVSQYADKSNLVAFSLITTDFSFYSSLFGIGKFFGICALAILICGAILIPLLAHRHSKKYNEVVKNIPELKMTRLQELLGNAYVNVNEFNLDSEQLDLSFPYEDFFVSAFRFKGDKFPTISKIVDLVLRESFELYKTQYVYTISTNHLIFIHNTNNKEINLEPFYAILGSLNDDYNIKAVIGIGDIKKTISLNESLLHAVSAADYASNDTAKLVLYTNIEESLLPFDYPQASLKHLENAVQAKEEDRIKEIISELTQILKNGNMPAFVMRNLGADIVKIYSDNTAISNPGGINIYSLLLRLSEAEGSESIIEIINKATKEVISSIETKKETESKKLADEIERYIEDNYTRCDFSIQEVAEHFSMASSSLSIFFKEEKNMNLLDLLISLRMKKAKELLKSTNLPLKTISEMIGYYNTSSFIRRFKSEEGITPNTYRFKEQS